jgi:hypothetical protein
MSVPRQQRATAVGLAVGGVLLGHAVSYTVVAPHAHDRAEMLASTGHAYLGFANDVGLVLGLAGLAAVFLGRLTRASGGRPAGFGEVAMRLLAFQMAAFVGMEVLERLTAGVSPLDLLHGGVLPVGLAVQALVALATALSIRWLLRAAERFAAVLATAAPLPAAATAGMALEPSSPAPARDGGLPFSIRGPPAAR